MLLAHIAFDTPYVLFSVLPRLQADEPQHSTRRRWIWAASR